MASSVGPSNGEIAVRPRQRGPQFKFLVPLIYAPILPLIRIGLRRNPVLRDRLFTAVLAGGFLHGSYLVLWKVNEHHLALHTPRWANVIASGVAIEGVSLPGFIMCTGCLKTDLYDKESK